MSITPPEMREAITAGTALPLLPDGVPGPVHHQGQWWCIPHGATEYEAVTDPALARQLDDHAAQLAAGARAVQQAQDRRQEQ